MRHVMVFTRAFRTPLQAVFSPTEADPPEDFRLLLEIADERRRQPPPDQPED